MIICRNNITSKRYVYGFQFLENSYKLFERSNGKFYYTDANFAEGATAVLIDFNVLTPERGVKNRSIWIQGYGIRVLYAMVEACVAVSTCKLTLTEDNKRLFLPSALDM